MSMTGQYEKIFIVVQDYCQKLISVIQPDELFYAAESYQAYVHALSDGTSTIGDDYWTHLASGSRASPQSILSIGNMSTLHLDKAERQINGIQADIDKLEAQLATLKDISIIARPLSEVSTSLATVSLTLRSAEETTARETSMDKRQINKQY